MQSTPLPFGNGTILVAKYDFQQGFQAGQTDYCTTQASHPDPFTDEELMDLFLEKLEDIRLSSLYGIGFIVGFLNALAAEGNGKGANHA